MSAGPPLSPPRVHTRARFERRPGGGGGWMNPPDQCSSPEAPRSRRDSAPRGGVCATHMDGGGKERGGREVGARGEGRERGKELTRACIRVYEVVHERVHHLHIVAPLSASDSSSGGWCLCTFLWRVGKATCVCVYTYVCSFSRFASGYWSKVFKSFFFFFF